nr:PREDICTED: BUD13 homolog isoform X2 [Bemisia tabaci]
MSFKSTAQQESGPPKPISQKEYLKKYLSNDSSSKKKKKKKIAPTSIQRSKIVDDDLDLKNMRLLGENELDLFQMDEDAPQIAGIIDERPPELQTLESYRNSKRWKVVAESDELTISDVHAEAEERKKLTSKNNKEIAHRFISHNIEKPDSERSKLNSKSEKNLDSKKMSKSSSSKLPEKSRHVDSSESSPRPSKIRKSKNDSDFSPTRSSKRNSGNSSDLSPPRPTRRKSKSSDSDQSPHRPSKNNKYSDDSDMSPPRKKVSRSKHRSGNDSDLSPPRSSIRRGNSSDLSPPRPTRRKSRSSDSDQSPRRPSKKNKYSDNSDLSPPRKKVSRSKHRSGNDSDLSPPRSSIRRGNSSDLSPPRPTRRKSRSSDSDQSPRRPSKKNKYSDNSDMSPPRKKVSRSKHRSGNDSDLSPPRSANRREPRNNSGSLTKNPSRRTPPRFSEKHWSSHNYNASSRRSKNRQSGSDSDLSPPRPFSKPFAKMERNSKDGKLSSSKDHSDKKPGFRDRSPESLRNSHQTKMTETLSGKRAGLQDAAALKEENVKFQEREDIAFKQMSASVSGEGAAAVVRDRRTGRRRDPEKEEAYKKRKEAVDGVIKEKYAKWGQGLKQTQEYQERLEELLHEAEKPFARHADDKDLDDFLKNQERDGDPMLEYLREKKEKSGASSNAKPVYKGPYPPNRFNIRPGFRWDGVDRSNGFEKQWFAKQNERKAVSDEAYKWSTSDM